MGKKVVAVDFQYAGKGLAVTDIVYFMGLSLEMKTYDEILELLKEYHNVLIKNGVEDFDFNTLVEEFEMMVVEQTMATLGMANMMKPKTFTIVLKSAQDNEEKTAQIKDFENG